MSEILFYHLTQTSLEHVLPGLIEKSLAKNWRVIVHCGSKERVEAIDALLWTYREDSFLPHGWIVDGSEAVQPIWLTAEKDNPNKADIRFLVDGAQVDETVSYSRIVYIFDGQDNSAVDHARSRWRFHNAIDGDELTYWQQTLKGGWEKRA
ncbi:MAG: DNA polymerase III subunit chi [Pseudomonadota bacterium]